MAFLQRRFQRPSTSIVWISVSLLTGCGRSSIETVPVQGIVRYQGQPLIGGTVSFHPVDAAVSRPGAAKINPDGSYWAATTQDINGLTPGDYLVSVLYLERPVFEVAPNDPSIKVRVPVRYQKPATSGITLSVPTDGDTVIYDIELHD